MCFLENQGIKQVVCVVSVVVCVVGVVIRKCACYKGGERRKKMLKFESWDEYNLRLVYRIIQILGIEETKDINKYEKIKYALSCILGEVEKFILLFSVFSIVSMQRTFLFIFLVLVSMRVFMGGSHRKTTLGCFFQSFLSFVVMILIDKYYAMTAFRFFVYIFAIISVVVFAPVSRQIQFKKSYKRKFKIRAMVVLMFWITISAGLKSSYENKILIVILYQSVEVTFVSIMEYLRRGVKR